MTRVSVNQGLSTFLWQRSIPVIVGCRFAGCTWKNKKLFASPAALCPPVADRAVNRTADCAVNRTADRAVNRTADRAVNRTADRAVNRTAR